MTLYASNTTEIGHQWIIEADCTGRKIGDIIFKEVPVFRTQEIIAREEKQWKEFEEESKVLGVPAYNGELIGMRDMAVTEDKLQVKLFKSNYKLLKSSSPKEGLTDSYTKQFFPYGYSIKNGIVRPKIPNSEKLFPAFALGVLIETADKRIVYLLRNSNVDAYKDAFSFNAGGRINGKPHQMIDELVRDSSSIQDHITGLLQQEYDNLDANCVNSQRLLSIARSLNDLDVTVSTHAKVDIPFSELEKKLRRGKYSGINSVQANSDGIIALLKKPFVSTIYMLPVSAAALYGVNPAEAVPQIKRIG